MYIGEERRVVIEGCGLLCGTDRLRPAPPRNASRPGPTKKADRIRKDGDRAHRVEEVAHARRAEAHVHLNELGRAATNERDAALPRHGARHQGLAVARRADEEDALGGLGAGCAELLGLAEEIDDLHQLDLGLFEGRL